MKELLICLGGVVICCNFLLREGKRFASPMKREAPQPSSVAGILRMTKINNTYPPLSEVLSSLQSSLEKKGIALHADMEDYMSNEKKQK